MKESIWKRIIIGFLGLLIVAWGLYKLSVGILICGVIIFALALILRLRLFAAICLAIIKNIAKADIVQEVAKETSEALKESYPRISDNEIAKIQSADTLGEVSATASNIVFEHTRESCANCGSLDVKEIEWSSEFDKFIGKENIINKQAFKCNNCGNTYLRYTTN